MGFGNNWQVASDLEREYSVNIPFHHILLNQSHSHKTPYISNILKSVPRCCITLGGEASRRTEGETSSAQGRPASQQQLSVRHLWPDVPVKDRALRPHQDASLVMRSVVSTAQSRVLYYYFYCTTTFQF